MIGNARATPTERMSIVQKLSHSLNDIGRLANYLSGDGLHLLGGNRFQIVPAFLNFGDEFWIFESVSDAFANRSREISGHRRWRHDRSTEGVGGENHSCQTPLRLRRFIFFHQLKKRRHITKPHIALLAGLNQTLHKTGFEPTSCWLPSDKAADIVTAAMQFAAFDR